MWFFLVAALLPAVMWYGHAMSLFRETGLTFGIFGGTGYDKWAHGLLLTSGFWSSMAERFTFSVLTPAGVVLVVMGIAGLWPTGTQGRQRWYLYAWLGGLLIYLLLVPEGNRKLHYYQMPFVPVGALFAALPLARLTAGGHGGSGRNPTGRQGFAGSDRGRVLAAVALLAIAGYSAWSASSYFDPGDNAHRFYRSSWEAGRLLDEKIPPDALLVTGELDDNSAAPLRAQAPTLLYYFHRKGWQIPVEQFSAGRLDSLSDLGASFFVTAMGYARSDTSFWRELLARGITSPSAYPRVWTDDRRFRRAATAQRGLDRHIVLVDLQRRTSKRRAAQDAEGPTTAKAE